RPDGRTITMPKYLPPCDARVTLPCALTDSLAGARHQQPSEEPAYETSQEEECHWRPGRQRHRRRRCCDVSAIHGTKPPAVVVRSAHAGRRGHDVAPERRRFGGWIPHGRHS